MDQIKLLVKDVLHKIQDIPDVPFTPIRMSELASESLVSPSPSKSASEQSISAYVGVKTTADQEHGNETTEAASLETNQINGKAEKSDHIFPHVIEITKPKNSSDSPQPRTGHNNGTEHYPTLSSDLTSLHIGGKGSHGSLHSVPNQPPKLSKADGKPSKGSHGSLYSVPNQSPNWSKADGKPSSRIVMGKRALLRSRSAELESHPAAVVHDLVHEKYHDKISHYIGRMYHRRLSRESRSTDDDGTNSNYSGSSLRTPDSLYDGKSYFSLFFPQRSEGDFDFLQSTDDLNKDTTDELFNSTVNSVDAKDTSADLEYDPRKFLKMALGDVSFDSQSMDMSDENGRLKYSQSADPVNGPSLLSKAGSLYSSVRKSIRRACSFRDKNGTGASPLNKTQRGKRCQSFSPECFNSAENLMRELYVQNGIIFQVSKALTFCRNSKDVRSPEYIEAEKILLVASCHKEAIQAALDATEFGEKDHGYCQKYIGTLEISDLIYYLKGDLSTEQTNVKNFDEYFVVVVTSGREVLSSKVLVADKNGEVKPDKMFRLTGLRTDFEVSVAIYSMMIKHVGKDSRHHHKKDRKVPCPSTRSLFFNLNHKSSRRSLLVDNISSIKPSSFTLWGSCTIRCSDLQKTHFRMHHVPLCSSLEGYFTASLNGHVKLSNRTRGFLTIGLEDKGHLIWNRRWCVLEGSLLQYWNYPSEECSCDPAGVIDLGYATEKTSPADRSICPRPKSLCLLVRNKDGLVLKYFLSADSLEEKECWREEINFVIVTLGSWNSLGGKQKNASS